MNRRQTWRAVGSAAALAALGAGLWWRVQHEAKDTSAPPASGTGAAALWDKRFETPDGGEIHMAAFKGQPLLLNFWGSWCPPCIAEMPDLDRFAREYGPAGWRVLGLAVDNPKAVREFLARTPVSYAIALAGFEGASLSRDLGNVQGGMPFSVVFRPDGSVVLTKLGATHWAELQSWAKKLPTTK